MASDLDALYRSHQIILWVEDVETKTYLEELWQDFDFGYRVGGGTPNIRGLVEDARRDNFGWVFGLVDRDFAARPARPARPLPPVLRCDRHEVENYALDAVAIRTSPVVNAAERTEAEIQDILHNGAQPFVPYMACRNAMTRLSQRLSARFPTHPTPEAVATLAQAEAAIVSSGWWNITLPTLTDLRPSVSTWLQSAEQTYRDALANGEWVESFSGKEILNRVINSIWTTGCHQGPGLRADFLKAVAEQQRKNGNQPQHLMDIRATVRQDVGLPP
jgi:hypothetical protein